MPIISNHLVACAGEYHVCAELCRRGILALVTPKNNPLFDVVATNAAGSDSVAIQVKTKNNKQGWKLNQGIEQREHNPDLFVILVDIHAEDSTSFYIYQYDDLSERVSRLYSDYMSKPKRDGSRHKEVTFRWFDYVNFTEQDRGRINKWDLIINRLQHCQPLHPGAGVVEVDNIG
jgi:hypothetical protein